MRLPPVDYDTVDPLTSGLTPITEGEPWDDDQQKIEPPPNGTTHNGYVWDHTVGRWRRDGRKA